MQPYLVSNQNSQVDVSQIKGDCFQIMGFDVFIDKNLKPWILEVNDSPSMNIQVCKEGPKGLLKQPSEIDKFVKCMCLGDAYELMI